VQPSRRDTVSRRKEISLGFIVDLSMLDYVEICTGREQAAILRGSLTASEYLINFSANGRRKFRRSAAASELPRDHDYPAQNKEMP